MNRSGVPSESDVARTEAADMAGYMEFWPTDRVAADPDNDKYL